MPRKGGFRREGSRGRFRYLDARGNRVTDAEKLERIKSLVIPPAWKDVWISGTASSKLQATGIDAAGRKQYIYHPNFRAQQEQAKFDRLIRFAERLPDLRAAMSQHMDNELLDRERVSAIATRLINRGWFRVGTERYARESKTYGITTLRKGHVAVRGNRIAFDFRGKHKSVIRTTLVDQDLADAIKELLALPREGRLFRYEWEGGLCALTGPKLNDYVRSYLGEEFTAKDFRTWGGTLIAAVALAERGPAETATEAKRAVTAVMRTVGEQLGNTPAVARSSYVSPAVIDQYLDGTTIEDFRPRHLRVVGARDLGLDREEQALLSLLRSWRIKQSRAAA
ncbi:MAG: topoisomerase [Gaiellaceae bacterium]|jgi:DNA topoisomerase-1|nr:topoisomerase [Gaiellaceae bacterium]